MQHNQPSQVYQLLSQIYQQLSQIYLVLKTGIFARTAQIVIPIDLATYNFAEVLVRFHVSNTCNIVLAGDTLINGTGGYLTVQECFEETQSCTGTTTITSTGNVAVNAYPSSIMHQIKIRLNKGSSIGVYGVRNMYSFETVYGVAGVGTVGAIGVGHIDMVN